MRHSLAQLRSEALALIRTGLRSPWGHTIWESKAMPVVALVVLVDCEKATASESGQSRLWFQHPET